MRRVLRLLAIPAVLLPLSAAVHSSPPMPYVIRSVPAPVTPGWQATGASLSMDGRTVAYVLRQSFCTPDSDECSSKNSILQYNGVEQDSVWSTADFIFSSKMSDKLVAWQVAESASGNIPLWTADRDGKVKRVSRTSQLDDFSVSGKDVAWEDVNPSTFRFDIYLNGKNITRSLPGTFNVRPETSGGNVVFQSGEPTNRLVLYDGAKNKFRNLPVIQKDQDLAPRGLAIGQDGQKVVWLLRDFLDPFTNNVLRTHDVPANQNRAYPQDGNPLQGWNYDGKRFFLWVLAAEGFGPRLQVTNVETGATEDLESTLDPNSAGYLPGNISHGIISYVINGAIRLYDVEDGDVTEVSGTGGEQNIASSKRNATWIETDAQTQNPVLKVAYPADQAVKAIADVVESYKLSPSKEGRLLDPLEDALDDLEDGRFGSARHEMEDFVEEVENLRGHGLSSKQANALRQAAEAVIDAL